MPMLPLHLDELRRLGHDPGASVPWSGPVAREVVVVDLDGGDAIPAPGTEGWEPAVVVVGTSRSPAGPPGGATDWCDVISRPDGPVPALVAATVERNPVASLALVTLLRRSAGLTVAQGLLAESAVYGVLQAGAEFRAWRGTTPPEPVPSESQPVIAVREDTVVRLTLNRSARRNAFDAAMRDALAEQLVVAILDPSIERVAIDGAGAAFCSGGDLDEFGTAPEPSVAHLVRLDRSVGSMIDAIRDRVTVHLHGACVGSGIELAAFAGSVTADASTSIALPEVSMGLIPGAGGTVSLVRRIGRHRTAELALSGRTIDAATALEWGLVDRVGLPAGVP
jgi:enoyl-CoA hydratase/carnithine racemase